MSRIEDLGILAAAGKQLRIDQRACVNDDIGFFQITLSLDRNEFRIARTRTNNMNHVILFLL